MSGVIEHFDLRRSIGMFSHATGCDRGRPMKKQSYTPADLNTGFVVAIDIENEEGEEDAVAALLQGMVAPTLAEPGVRLFLPPILRVSFSTNSMSMGRMASASGNGSLQSYDRKAPTENIPARTSSVSALLLAREI
jgi:hypothetical protein